MASKKEQSKNAKIEVRVTEEVKNWLSSQVGGISGFLTAQIDQAMGKDPTATSEIAQSKKVRIPILEGYGYIKQTFKNHDSFIKFLKMTDSTLPNYNPFEANPFPKDISEYPKEFINNYLDVSIKQLGVEPSISFGIKVTDTVKLEAKFGIREGDIVIVDRTLHPKDTSMAVAWYENDFHFIELERKKEKWCLKWASGSEILSEVDFENWLQECFIGIAVYRFGKLTY